jgi:hypothetical protein
MTGKIIYYYVSSRRRNRLRTIQLHDDRPHGRSGRTVYSSESVAEAHDIDIDSLNIPLPSDEVFDVFITVFYDSYDTDQGGTDVVPHVTFGDNLTAGRDFN